MPDQQTSSIRFDTESHGACLLVRIHAGALQEFGAAVALQLEALLGRVEQDPGIRAVVFASAHATRFMSHADVRWLQEGGANFLAQRKAGTPPPPPPPDYVGLDRLHGLFLRMNSIGVVFVAAMEGMALGLGAEFCWACDLRVMAARDAFIGQPEILLGIMPGGGGSQRLTRLVGGHRALLAILDGAPLAPAHALQIGAVDAVVERDQVIAKALELAEYKARRSKAAIGAIKRAVYFGGSLPLEEGIKLETREFLGLDFSEQGQALMLAYMAGTGKFGELPLYVPGEYEAALERGSTPSAY